MERIIITTGLMRTGTSLIAKQLHELGVPMGSQMRFPFPRESGQLDWEDVEFTDKCLSAVKGTIKKARLKIFFNQYMRRRQGDLWGVKSPFLYPYVELFKAEAAALGKTVKVIRTTRPIGATFESIRNQTALDEPVQIQRILMTYPDPKADLIVPIIDSWNDPEQVKQKLVELIKE